MPFEILKPKVSRAKLKGLVLSISKSFVTLSKDLMEDWPENCNHIQIFLDRSNKLLAIKPRKNSDDTTIVLSKNKKTGMRSFQSKILKNSGINVGKVKLHFDKKNGMYVGQYPDGSKIDGKIGKDLKT